KYRLGGQAELARELRQGRAFVERNMAETRIDIVAHERELRDAAAIFRQVIVDDLGIATVAGDEAEGRIGVLVEPGMEPGADPGDDAGQISPDARKYFGVGVRAG